MPDPRFAIVLAIRNMIFANDETSATCREVNDNAEDYPAEVIWRDFACGGNVIQPMTIEQGVVNALATIKALDKDKQ